MNILKTMFGRPISAQSRSRREAASTDAAPTHAERPASASGGSAGSSSAAPVPKEKLPAGVTAPFKRTGGFLSRLHYDLSVWKENDFSRKSVVGQIGKIYPVTAAVNVNNWELMDKVFEERTYLHCVCEYLGEGVALPVVMDLCMHGGADPGRAGAVINMHFDDGAVKNFPIHSAVHNTRGGGAEAVRGLVVCGADVNAPDSDNNTALHLAAFWGNTSVALSLLDMGADPTAQDKDKHTAAEVARERGHTALAELLEEAVKRGAKTLRHVHNVQRNTFRDYYKDLHKTGQNPRDIASSRPKFTRDNALQDMGIWKGCNRTREEVAALFEGLTQHGKEELAKKTNQNGNSLLDFAACLCPAGHSGGVVMDLIALGADPDKSDNRGSTPLHWAAWNSSGGGPEAIVVLVACGVRINPVGDRTMSPLLVAAGSRAEEPHRFANVDKIAHLIRVGGDRTITEITGKSVQTIARNSLLVLKCVAEAPQPTAEEILRVRQDTMWEYAGLFRPEAVALMIIIKRCETATDDDQHMENQLGAFVNIPEDIVRAIAHIFIVSATVPNVMGRAEAGPSATAPKPKQ